ncbi:uncharacterized protein LOC132719979 [Ruditapes philippinarum]|uniref:uncharacterized protein LOC132719979 n=1 Tax=Ruditapes philippinarum TaxID=129788 RepID=UPI00295BC747|nr:uncharacterized protein LOC132719979 [Ruditapes philippinarum]
MCTTEKAKIKRCKCKKKGRLTIDGSDAYFQLENPDEHPQETKALDKEKNGRVLEKTVFVLTSVGIILLTHGITWAQWILPITFATLTPLLVGIKTFCYWKNKWQYFMVDFCYFANTLTLVYLWLPDAGGELFRVVFALANGPVLVAAAVYRNSLVYHNHDKITSCYIHFLPALLTFCIRWFPESTSQFWVKDFITDDSDFDVVWLYAVPLASFFVHSALYCLIINVVMRPREPYVTSYSYLAEKYNNLKCIDGKWGQGLVYYGMNWLFCLTSLLPAVLAYSYFSVHCTLIALVFLVVLWNGASYYVHVFSERGFNVSE